MWTVPVFTHIFLSPQTPAQEAYLPYPLEADIAMGLEFAHETGAQGMWVPTGMEAFKSWCVTPHILPHLPRPTLRPYVDTTAS